MLDLRTKNALLMVHSFTASDTRFLAFLVALEAIVGVEELFITHATSIAIQNSISVPF